MSHPQHPEPPQHPRPPHQPQRLEHPDQPRSSAADADRHVVVGVDLSAAGARPGAQRARGPQAPRSFDGRRFAELVRRADLGGVDLVTLDESFLLHPGRGRLTGRLDAAVAAARVAPCTTRVGLVAAVETVHVDAAHVAAAIASADRESAGRVGWQVGLPPTLATSDDAWAQQAAADADAVARHWAGDGRVGAVRLDAEGRHAVEHDGVRFAVRRDADPVAPSPQGRPPVVVRVRTEADLPLAARVADVVRVAVGYRGRAAELRERLHAAAAAAGRDVPPRVLADAYVVLSADRASAQARLELVETLEGPGVAHGALVFAGTAGGFADLVGAWREVGAVDGFVLRPSSLGPDLDAIVDQAMPALEVAGLRREVAPVAATTLRTALGLPAAGGAPTAVAPAPAAPPEAPGRAPRGAARRRPGTAGQVAAGQMAVSSPSR
ncbi:F420-dependent oxidoreductase [Puerhibacterium sp. TATVAM-FAB25]|uniref:F420-dependent oxidoreductase n=1 Tax=Puerhibacterium sp. TATVAM-FAB25 TaxID=3093699 RepID=UPI00397B8B1C